MCVKLRSDWDVNLRPPAHTCFNNNAYEKYLNHGECLSANAEGDVANMAIHEFGPLRALRCQLSKTSPSAADKYSSAVARHSRDRVERQSPTLTQD
jgi:hypothetical protein